ncbi:plant phospholipase-like protein [Medicago truncatula]|uniref:Plant phospholipase-like protein n=1 Tax=Medicago truncatula TaxID=3880 RepID=A0A072V4K5_MEDTR|nr:plant phospholipase-like protein [Medicago truncatula]
MEYIYLNKSEMSKKNSLTLRRKEYLIQLESKGGNHVYARTKLNPKSTSISDRTLRSSKTPVKTGTTSLCRCSEPHISRGRSSAPEEIQEPDVPTAQAVNMACQAPGEVSGQIQPPRYLVSDPVAHPPTLEQELGQKEARNVENSTVYVPERMEEEDKDENSLSSRSRTGCSPPAPAYSQRLTELAAMAAENDDDDEVDSEVQSRTEDSVNEYKVKTELIPILRKVIGKHGDIAKNCTSKLVRFRAALLGMICEIISEKSVDIAESAVEDCEAKIKNLEDQIKKFEDQKALWKVKLAKSRDEFTRTYNETISATAKINRFRNSSLADGLL